MWLVPGNLHFRDAGPNSSSGPACQGRLFLACDVWEPGTVGKGILRLSPGQGSQLGEDLLQKHLWNFLEIVMPKPLPWRFWFLRLGKDLGIYIFIKLTKHLRLTLEKLHGPKRTTGNSDGNSKFASFNLSANLLNDLQKCWDCPRSCKCQQGPARTRSSVISGTSHAFFLFPLSACSPFWSGWGMGRLNRIPVLRAPSKCWRGENTGLAPFLIEQLVTKT